MLNITEKQYSQPSFYHFSRDSISLANFINKRVLLQNKKNLLEVGAGSGVITCELLRLVDDWQGSLTLLEKQVAFLSHLKDNLEESLDVLNVNYSIYHDDFLSWADNYPFDLIYYNPPYFFSEETRPNPLQEKDLCRRIQKKKLKSWIDKSRELIGDQGDIFFSHRLNNLHEILELDEPTEVYREPSGDGCFLYHYCTRL